MAECYTAAMSIPPIILLPPSEQKHDTWTKLLSERAGRRVELRTPQRGDKVELMGMAHRNAVTGLESELALPEPRGEAPGVKELQQLLQREDPPWRIAGYSSTTRKGTHA